MDGSRDQPTWGNHVEATTDLRADLSLGVAVADWVRNTVMLVVLATWVVYIAVAVARDRGVEPIVWGLPVTMYFALNPSWKKGSRDGPS